MNRTVVIDKLERYCIYPLVNSSFGRQPVYRSKLLKISMMNFIKFVAKMFAFNYFA